MTASRQIGAWLAPVAFGALLVACSSTPAANPAAAAVTQATTAAAAANNARAVAQVTWTAIADNAVAARAVSLTAMAAADAASATRMTVTRTAAAENIAAAQAATTTARQAAVSATSTVNAAAAAAAGATRTSVAVAATEAARPTPTAVLPVAIARATPGAVAVEGVAPLTNFRTTLLLLHRYPELATDKALLDAVTQQVQAEQQAWRGVDCFPRLGFQDPLCANLLHPQKEALSPKRSTFVFEWQKYLDSDPDLARGPLLSAFADPQADWSFVKRERDWDDSFDNLVQVMLFQRESIKDREPSFAARELVPIYRHLVDAAAASQPSRFTFKVDLPAGQYDLSSSTYKFANNTASPNLDLLGQINEAGFPDETRGRANYSLSGGAHGYSVAGGEQEAGTVYGSTGVSPNGLRLRLPINQMTALWRGGVVQLLLNLPMAAISLDHQLQLSPISVEPARAEKLTKRAPQFQARVYINVDHAWTYDRPLGGTNKQPQAGLFARIERVDVFALMQPLPTPGTISSGGLDELLLATFS